MALKKKVWNEFNEYWYMASTMQSWIYKK